MPTLAAISAFKTKVCICGGQSEKLPWYFSIWKAQFMISNPQVLLEMQLVSFLAHKPTGPPDQSSDYFIELHCLESFCSCAYLSWWNLSSFVDGISTNFNPCLLQYVFIYLIQLASGSKLLIPLVYHENYLPEHLEKLSSFLVSHVPFRAPWGFLLDT